MKLPLITRSHHEDIVLELRQQIAKLEVQNEKMTDLILKLSVGRTLYAENIEEPVRPEPETEPENEVEAAVQRSGSRMPSRVRRAIEQKNAVQHVRLRQRQQEPVEAVSDMQRAFD